MDDLNFIDTIFQLLPGFVAAEIIYIFTSYLKPSPFERVIQALVLTVFVRGFVFLTICLYCEENQVFSENTEFIISVLYSVILGIIISICINNDFPNKLLRKIPKVIITNKTLHPSEWFSFFSESASKPVTLHLEGERRIVGYVIQYPDDPNEGHFILQKPGWIDDEKDTINYFGDDDRILISVKEVIRVEISNKEC